MPTDRGRVINLAIHLDDPEPTCPLHVRVCEACLLAQVPPLITPEETFTEYAYFSSFSTSWCSTRSTSWTTPFAGCRSAATPSWSKWRAMTGTSTPSGTGSDASGSSPRPTSGSGSGDWCAHADAFLDPETGAATRAEHGPADLVVANNVYAHIPDLVGFTEDCVSSSPSTAGCRSRCCTCSPSAGPTPGCVATVAGGVAGAAAGGSRLGLGVGARQTLGRRRGVVAAPRRDARALLR